MKWRNGPAICDTNLEAAGQCRGQGLSICGLGPNQAARRSMSRKPGARRRAVQQQFRSGTFPLPNIMVGAARDAAAVVKNLDRGVGSARFDVLADEPRRHRVVMVVNGDVIVGRDAAFFPFRIAIGLIRKGGERRPKSLVAKNAGRTGGKSNSGLTLDHAGRQFRCQV
jgi:hypothetical protein